MLNAMNSLKPGFFDRLSSQNDNSYTIGLIDESLLEKGIGFLDREFDKMNNPQDQNIKSDLIFLRLMLGGEAGVKYIRNSTMIAVFKGFYFIKHSSSAISKGGEFYNMPNIERKTKFTS